MTTVRASRDQGRVSNVIGRLATELSAEFPEMKGLSRANPFSLRGVAGGLPADAGVQQAVGRLPFGHKNVVG